jgi:glyoxylate reductase
VKPSVFVSRRIPAAVRAELDRSFAVTIHDAELPPAEDDLLVRVAGSHGLVTMLTDRVDAQLFDAAGDELRIVAHYAVGYDTVDVEAATRRGIVVTNTPDVLTGATAELTLALLLALSRRVVEGDRLVRRGVPWSWAPTFMLGRGLSGKTLGIVGLGRIGRAVALLAEGFGMRVAYTSRGGPKDDVDLEWLPLDGLLASSDVVSLHCPLTAETHHLIGREELRTMRRDALLVNAARGPLVDEAALVEGLRDGEIAGAALDVFEREPEVGEALLGLESAVLVPHLGSATREVREAMGMICVQALQSALLESRCPPNAVNPQAWERARRY